MNLSFIAAALLLAGLAHHAVSGGVTRFLLDKLHAEPADKAENRFHNAVLAVLLATVLWIGLVILLIVPATPNPVELGAGALIIAGTIGAAVYRQAMNIRSLLLIAAGTLILAENLT